MKSFTTAILALGVALVSAQTTMPANMTTTMTTSSTSTYTDCTDVPDVTLTSTNTVTITYCSSCTMNMGPSTVHTTVNVYTYTDVCPTGVSSGMPTPVTYTVTESCTGATPPWSSGTDYVPQGFTTSAGVCNICPGSPTSTLYSYIDVITPLTTSFSDPHIPNQLAACSIRHHNHRPLSILHRR